MKYWVMLSSIHAKDQDMMNNQAAVLYALMMFTCSSCVVISLLVLRLYGHEQHFALPPR
jgi:hypothetical protein